MKPVEISCNHVRSSSAPAVTRAVGLVRLQVCERHPPGRVTDTAKHGSGRYGGTADAVQIPTDLERLADMFADNLLLEAGPPQKVPMGTGERLPVVDDVHARETPRQIHPPPKHRSGCCSRTGRVAHLRSGTRSRSHFPAIHPRQSRMRCTRVGGPPSRRSCRLRASPTVSSRRRLFGGFGRRQKRGIPGEEIPAPTDPPTGQHVKFSFHGPNASLAVRDPSSSRGWL